MTKTLHSLTIVALAAASLTAQCVPPTATPQFLPTIDFTTSTTVFLGGTAPLYGMTINPGPGIRFDLAATANISITEIGTNIMPAGTYNFGGTVGVVTVPNLVGAPNGTMQVWVVPSDSVLNPALYPTNTYSSVPYSPPANASWTLLSTQATHVSNLVWQNGDTPSVATFNPPLNLAAGNYAVQLVFCPQGTATIPLGGGVAATANDRCHPLLTNLNSVPSPTSVTDGFITLSNPGVASAAFNNGVLSPLSATPYMPHFSVRYTLASGIAYSTGFGQGCYNRPQSFYESFAPVAVPGGGAIDLQNSQISMFNIGNGYIATAGAGTFPNGGITPGSTTYYSSLPTPLPVSVTSGPTGANLWGDWDDSISVAYPLPFPFSYPGDGGVPATQIFIGSNGAIWLGSAPTNYRFLNVYSAWLNGPPSFAVSYCDWYPADLFTSLGGTGQIFADSDGASYVTISWVNCIEYPNTANNSSGNNFQITLTASGGVDLTFGSVKHGTSEMLVGFTPGNGAVDPGSGPTPRQVPDLSAAVAGPGYVSGDGITPAVISLANRPKVGDPLTINTNGIHSSVPINITLISTGSLPGIDLGFINMPGCNAYITLPEVASNFGLVGGGSSSWPALASIPPAFAGVNLYAQSAQFASGFPVSYNGANILVSSAVCIHFDQF